MDREVTGSSVEGFAPVLTFIRKMPGVSRCSMYSQDNGLVASVLTIPGSYSIQSCPPPTAHRGVTHIWGIKKKEELKPSASFQATVRSLNPFFPPYPYPPFSSLGCHDSRILGSRTPWGDRNKVIPIVC